MGSDIQQLMSMSLDDMLNNLADRVRAVNVRRAAQSERAKDAQTNWDKSDAEARKNQTNVSYKEYKYKGGVAMGFATPRPSHLDELRQAHDDKKKGIVRESPIKEPVYDM